MSEEQRKLGKYELQSRLAQGGMGEVWKAFDTQLKRVVAIKLLRADLQHDPEFTVRFEREAQLIASLRHPNIVQIHDFDITTEDDGRTVAYMVMDYVKGQTLADYIRATARKGLFPSADDLTYIFAMISIAMDYAHEKGMIHRDIKPANILLDQRLTTTHSMGEPVLTDFGIARLQGVATGTVVGSLLGTPLYISPEQAKGLHGDKRSDLYSLGIILYEITTGVTPFRGETTMSILVQHLNDMPTPPGLINPNIPHTLSTVILKSIAKQPEDRYNSASEMTLALAESLHTRLPEQFIHTLRANSRKSSPPSTPGSITRTLAANPTPTRITDMHGIQTRVDHYQQTRPQYTPAQSIPPLYTTPVQQAPGYSAQASVYQALPEKASKSQKSAGSSKRRLGLLLALPLLALLISAGITTFLLQQHRPASSGSGQQSAAGLLQLQGGTAGSVNQLHIEVNSIQSPPSGHHYYAWVYSSTEGNPPHWALTVQNNAINNTVNFPQAQQLLSGNPLFLITDETFDQPVTPNIGAKVRLYYARMSASATQFTLLPCPQSDTNNACQ